MAAAKHSTLSLSQALGDLVSGIKDSLDATQGEDAEEVPAGNLAKEAEAGAEISSKDPKALEEA